MASRFLSISGGIDPLLPREGHCPACHGELEWGEVIRSCYGRKAGQEMERAEKEKEMRKAEKKAARNLEKESLLVAAGQVASDTDATATATDLEDSERDHLYPIDSLRFATSPGRGRVTGMTMMTAVRLDQDGANPKKRTHSQKMASADPRLERNGKGSVRARARGSALSGGRGQGKLRNARATGREPHRVDGSMDEHSGSESDPEWVRLEREMMSLL